LFNVWIGTEGPEGTQDGGRRIEEEVRSERKTFGGRRKGKIFSSALKIFI
jgi:hypothetical protein